MCHGQSADDHVVFLMSKKKATPPKKATAAAPWLPWYDLQRWRKMRAYQLKIQPLCQACLRNGITTATEVCDHVIAHHGDPKLFWFGELRSLCRACHDGFKQRLEKRGKEITIGLDGWPIEYTLQDYVNAEPDREV
jgi:hypothetical protein